MAERISFMVEDAPVLFKNFEGREKKFNQKGDRNFVVALPDELAVQMIEDGWNVKMLKPKEDDEDGIARPIITVKVRFDKIPPRIYLITDTSRTRLDEDTVDSLDWVDIRSVDLIARGHWYDMNGDQGYTAYLKSLFVIINEDPLEKKYQINEHPPTDDEE